MGGHNESEISPGSLWIIREKIMILDSVKGASMGPNGPQDPSSGESGRLTSYNCHQKVCASSRMNLGMSPRRPGRLVVATGVAFLLILSMVQSLPGGVDADGAITTLRIGMVQSIDSLNPFIGINDNAYVFYGLVYDYLICLDGDLQPKPNLANSWHVVPDYEPYGSVWQYNLTEHATWHDGEPMTADDVVFTFDYQTGLNWVQMWAYQPYTLLVDDVEKIDAYTVRIHYADPNGPVACSFGDGLMMPIVPKHIWKDVTVAEAGFSYINELPIGTGPFICTDRTYDEFLQRDRMILYRNPDYHGGPDYGSYVQFDRLILEFYLEPAAMLIDLQRGVLDLAQFDAPTFASLEGWLEKNPTDKIQTYAGRKCTGYSVEICICLQNASGYNPTKTDLAVRQAMAHATDKDFIVEHIYKGYGEKGSTILSPVYPYWYWEPDAEQEYYFDFDRANEILDAAGYPWNDDHTVRYAPPGHPYNPSSDNRELSFELIVEQEIIEDRATALFLAEQWAEVGIDLEPVFVTTAMWGTLVYGGTFDLTLTYWSGDPDPNYLLFIQATAALNGWSETWYSDPEYDANYTASILEVDPEKRLEYVYNCQELMYHDVGYIVTAYPFECTAWRTDRFSGWGDWYSYPGRSLSNFWTGNDLYFDLEPVSTNEPPFLILDNVAGPADMTLQVTAFAEDPEGVAMDYTLDFGDGPNTTGKVPSDGEISVSHTYTSPGEYLLSLSATDDVSGSRQTAVATIIGPGGNAPPSNVRAQPSSIKGEVDSQMTFTISGWDYEGDSVAIELDFGDSSDAYSAVMTGTSDGFEDVVIHEYGLHGEYVVTLSANDSHNETTTVFSLVITEPSGGGGLVLIIGMAALAAIVAVVTLFMIRRRKKGPKEEEDVRLP
jgi:peptide/nickel transport system substrate-binding protein